MATDADGIVTGNSFARVNRAELEDRLASLKRTLHSGVVETVSDGTTTKYAGAAQIRGVIADIEAELVRQYEGTRRRTRRPLLVQRYRFVTGVEE